MVSCSDDLTIKIWRCESETNYVGSKTFWHSNDCCMVFQGGEMFVFCCYFRTFSHAVLCRRLEDKRLLALASDDGTVKIWELVCPWPAGATYLW
ncbi:hypothetical protein K7X08_015625 [Anisodus acutangulus]|uniref:Uncharacterized protein n=1 Tax=Anisodus acutangulus TaxID=402998 RepID=A0A9Q1LDJ7_9SOLA|nr:hypothetical protein K7X08_015625 [Anisodus acutangulus]